MDTSIDNTMATFKVYEIFWKNGRIIVNFRGSGRFQWDYITLVMSENILIKSNQSGYLNMSSTNPIDLSKRIKESPWGLKPTRLKCSE